VSVEADHDLSLDQSLESRAALPRLCRTTENDFQAHQEGSTPGGTILGREGRISCVARGAVSSSQGKHGALEEFATEVQVMVRQAGQCTGPTYTSVLPALCITMSFAKDTAQLDRHMAPGGAGQRARFRLSEDSPRHGGQAGFVATPSRPSCGSPPGRGWGRHQVQAADAGLACCLLQTK
jgi:hypothetical protein